ncbi:hypothetical protein [Haloplasma contractile]|uniref:Uncharacterized protein n=1 Tax=Haloplasma contractile SSD-17B TaxID=1033810 RepID=F7PU58_9MOLU|nr:hypothetical protein [Haloplasma contractile]ERJ11764.1 hypothetical protein HLPCO_002247 [Haloplasma contractile SSD-17B]
MSLRFFISNTLLMAFFIFLIGFGWWCIIDDGKWIMSIPDEQVTTIMGAFSEVIIAAVIMLKVELVLYSKFFISSLLY